MSGLFLLAALIGIVYLMVWMIQNDGAKRIEDQTGLLRMTRPASAVPVPVEEPKGPKRRGPMTQPAGERVLGRGRPDDRRPTVTPTARTPEPEAEEEIVHPLWQGRPRRRR